jgi:hypothetical protein
MVDIVRTMGVEAPMTTSNSTYSNAHLVRITASSNTLVTRANNGVTVGTFTALGGQVTWAGKAPFETFAANSGTTANAAACGFAS